jgi:hypothetical protein
MKANLAMVFFSNPHEKKTLILSIVITKIILEVVNNGRTIR